MPVTAKLQRLIDDELSRASALAERTADLVLPQLQQAPDPAQAEHCRALAHALVRQRSAFVRAFSDALRTHVWADMEGGETSSAPTAKSRGLELMDETRIEVDIEISGAAQLIMGAAEWELRELQTFTSTLAGYAHVVAGTNPLQPTAYARALWEASCAVTPDAQQRTILLHAAASAMSGQLKMAWAAACSRLEEQGVEPSMYRTVVLAPGAAIPREPVVDVARPGALQNLLPSMPVAEAAGETPPATQRAADAPRGFEDALSRLDGMLRRQDSHSASEPAPQRSEHQASMLASPAQTVDRQIVELLSRLFESVLADGRLPPMFQAVMARLQVSALRVALVDQGMLSAHDHPVWRLMNRIASMAETYSQPTDPRCVALLEFCRALAEDMARAQRHDSTLYTHGLDRLESFLAEQLGEQQLRAQPATQALIRLEQREAMQRQVVQLLTEQMAPIRTTAAVRQFILGDWAKALAHAMQHHGEKAEATLAYMKATEDLLWSLRLPDHPQSRKRLLSVLPALLQKLGEGMTLAGIAQPDQEAVLGELMAVHTEALRPGKDASPEEGLTSQEVVQRMRDEPTWEAASRPAFTDSLIDLHSLDTVPAELLQGTLVATGSNAEAAQRVQSLRCGDRQHLFLHGRWTRVQLLWRSAGGGYFLFAGADPARPHSMTRRALERLSEEGLMKPMDDVSLIQRAADRLMRKLTLPA